MAVNDRISQDVLDGRMTLGAAAAEFEAVNADAWGTWEHYAEHCPGWSKRKLSAHGVILGMDGMMLEAGQGPAERINVLLGELGEWHD